MTSALRSKVRNVEALASYQPPPPPPPPPEPEDPPPPEKLDEEELGGAGMVEAIVEAMEEENPPIRSPKLL